MKFSLRLLKPIHPIPLSQIPPALLRLPPKPSPKPSASSSSSPTLERLVQSINSNRPIRRRSTGLAGDGRGLGNAIGLDVERDLEREVEAEGEAAAEGQGEERGNGLPANLRVEEYVPKRQEYGGVKSSHRDLVS